MSVRYCAERRQRYLALILDKDELIKLQDEWAGVKALREKLKRSSFASVGIVGGTLTFELANAAHNLPFLHAFSKLNSVLEELAKDGHFQCNSQFLGALVKKSEEALSWQDYTLICEGVELRNKLAHQGHILERGDCWKFVDAIEKELSAWNII